MSCVNENHKIGKILLESGANVNLVNEVFYLIKLIGKTISRAYNSLN
jgi:hypothetical protein